MSELPSDATHRQIDRIPQPGEVIFYRRYHHGDQAEQVERLTVTEPPATEKSPSETIIWFNREDGTSDLIIAKFRCHIPVGGPDEFNKFLFWN